MVLRGLFGLAKSSGGSKELCHGLRRGFCSRGGSGTRRPYLDTKASQLSCSRGSSSKPCHARVGKRDVACSSQFSDPGFWAASQVPQWIQAGGLHTRGASPRVSSSAPPPCIHFIIKVLLRLQVTASLQLLSNGNLESVDSAVKVGQGAPFAPSGCCKTTERTACPTSLARVPQITALHHKGTGEPPDFRQSSDGYWSVFVLQPNRYTVIGLQISVSGPAAVISDLQSALVTINYESYGPHGPPAAGSLPGKRLMQGFFASPGPSREC